MNNKTNILDSFTLLFAKLYAENVINKDFHKDAVASFGDAGIETREEKIFDCESKCRILWGCGD